ncbi:MAG: hypothetical protein HY712_04170 [candidate division NC10 bacterium]|nr:hypothetical protein [candidate division NC10 bacterium]
MSPRRRMVGTKGGESATMIRTTLLMPEELWKAAKVRAIEEGDLRTVMLNALEEYLAKPARARPRKGGA